MNNEEFIKAVKNIVKEKGISEDGTSFTYGLQKEF